ncbi:MAG: hypothetical protein KC518_04915 [Candidatus Cloacimonetes bacterium]|nr:hypothetical protein [Candidatus Cloacimonadota bacterium]
MAQLESWEKVYMDHPDGFAAIEPVHSRVGCVGCHGGTDPVVARSENINDLFTAMMEAHEADITYTATGTPDRTQVDDHAMLRDPSMLPELNCNGASCHADHVEKAASSLHNNLWGEKHKVALRAGYPSFEACPAELKEAYSAECTSCHASCGQCHISRPLSVKGGFLDGHRFQRTPDQENNCTACHGSRVGNDYSGHMEGNQPDVHQQLGFDCLFCHQENMHGDGRTDYTSRYEVEGLPTCTRCHSQSADRNIYHDTHWQGSGAEMGLSCNVCHSQPYTSCINCHTGGVWSSDDPQGYAEFPSFRIGRNSGNWSTHPASEESYVVVRHVPISEDSYAPWGWPRLESWAAFETWEYASPHNIARITRQTQVAATGPVDASNCWISCHSDRNGPFAEENRGLFLWESFVDSLGQHVSNTRQTEGAANRNVVVDRGLPDNWLRP